MFTGNNGFPQDLRGSANQGYAGMSNLMSLRPKVAPAVAAPVMPATQARPMSPMTQMPQTGWETQGAAPPSLDAILNGQTQQFGQSVGASTAMPSPQNPQQNYDALGQSLMQKILAGQGGV